MGFACGFDISPRLEVNDENKKVYQNFLDDIIKKYSGIYDEKGRWEGGKILDLPNSSKHSAKNLIQLMIGECPRMPSSPEYCNYFLRFSSKVSGSLTTAAEPYIMDVLKIAKKYFGSRVHFWHELNEFGDPEQQFGVYDWREVNDAERELRELEPGKEESE